MAAVSLGGLDALLLAAQIIAIGDPALWQKS